MDSYQAGANGGNGEHPRGDAKKSSGFMFVIFGSEQHPNTKQTNICIYIYLDYIDQILVLVVPFTEEQNLGWLF